LRFSEKELEGLSEFQSNETVFGSGADKTYNPFPVNDEFA